MVWFVVIVGILKIACCLITLVVPNFLRKAVGFVSIGSRLYLVGFLRLVLGVLLLILAYQVRLWGYVVTIGLLASASGLSIFFLALKRTKKLLQRLVNQSNLVLRLLAILAIAIWAVLIYSLLPAIPVPACYPY